MTRTLRSQAGFTLIEVLVASVVLIVGVLSALTLLDSANGATVTNRSREAGINLARELTETSRGLPYQQISTSSLPGLLQAQPGLEDSGAGGTYTIRRRGITYTIGLDSCIMDERRDGGGDHSSGGFCAESTTANSFGDASAADANPEDYKRVTATTTWTLRGVTRTVKQTTIVNNPGSAGGPKIASLKLGSYSNPPPQLTLANESDEKVEVNFTTSSRAERTAWMVDGKVQPLAPVNSDGSARMSWSVTWDYSGLLNATDRKYEDGTYTIGAQAFDRYNTSGPGRSLVVRLNRYLARKPTGLAGGRNKGLVELEWNPNRERDIAGYVVYRYDGAAETVVCPLQQGTRCTLSSEAATGTLIYRVRAFDYDGNDVPRAGAYSDALTVPDPNYPPNAPALVSLTANGDGTTTIRWQRATDPDPGDRVDFYRIYRDGQAIDDRYARWYDTSAVVAWTDNQTANQPHDYWITAVDSHYTESLASAISG